MANWPVRFLAILGALAASVSVSVRAPSKLTSLSLHNLRASDPHPLETLPLRTALRHDIAASPAVRGLQQLPALIHIPRPLARLLGHTLASSDPGSDASHPRRSGLSTQSADVPTAYKSPPDREAKAVTDSTGLPSPSTPGSTVMPTIRRGRVVAQGHRLF